MIRIMAETCGASARTLTARGRGLWGLALRNFPQRLDHITHRHSRCVTSTFQPQKHSLFEAHFSTLHHHGRLRGAHLGRHWMSALIAMPCRVWGVPVRLCGGPRTEIRCLSTNHRRSAPIHYRGPRGPSGQPRISRPATLQALKPASIRTDRFPTTLHHYAANLLQPRLFRIEPEQARLLQQPHIRPDKLPKEIQYLAKEHPDDLVLVKEGDDIVTPGRWGLNSNGAVMYPNSQQLQELIRDRIEEGLAKNKDDWPFIYTISRETPVPDGLALVDDFGDGSRYSLQPSGGEMTLGSKFCHLSAFIVCGGQVLTSGGLM